MNAFASGGRLQVFVNSDKNINVDDRVITFVREKAEQALERFKNRLTRVEVHLSDVNSHKFAAIDKRCMIEARPAGRQPVAVTMIAANVKSALRGSLSKLQSALEKYFARSRKGAPSIRRTAPPPDLPVAATARVKKSAVEAKPRTGVKAKSKKSNTAE